MVANKDIDAVISSLNQRAGGERSCLSAPQPNRSYDFNFLRLGQTGLISQSMTASTIRYREDAAGAFYLCLNNRLHMTQGRQSFEAGRGQLMCVLPGADRTIHYGEDFRSFVVRINEAALGEAMGLLGHEGSANWSNITSVVGAQSPIAKRFCKLLWDTVEMYDSDSDFPDRQVDAIMGESLAIAAASMLASMVSDQPRIDGPSYVVAEAVEQVIVQRFAGPLTTSEIARAVGQSIPCVKASLLLHTGLLPSELLTLVRLIAADEYSRRSFNEPKLVAQACGFVTDERYQLALTQWERLNGLMKKRAKGRGFPA
ncbi:hypothetical protein WDZ92_30470 [Nostoc sp. NIES-2111]